MPKEPRRPDIARDLLVRASRAVEYQTRLARGPLSRVESEMGRLSDRAHAQFLRRVMVEHGWPGRDLVGAEASHAAWWLAVHADAWHGLQNQALRLLSVAVERGDATRPQWAHLLDRCRVNAGETQLYGTQYHLGPGGVRVLPTRAPQHLDARRASVGLGPFAAALEELRQRHATGLRTVEAVAAVAPGLVRVRLPSVGESLEGAA